MSTRQEPAGSPISAKCDDGSSSTLVMKLAEGVATGPPTDTPRCAASAASELVNTSVTREFTPALASTVQDWGSWKSLPAKSTWSAGGGVGGLTLANALNKHAHFDVKVVEKTAAFRRFGGPIQLASNALEVFRHLDPALAQEIEDKATYTGDKVNGIKDGIRGSWYAKFDLKTPAEVRDMQYTCVVDRSELQNALLKRIQDKVQNGSPIKSYNAHERGVTATLDDGTEMEAADRKSVV